MMNPTNQIDHKSPAFLSTTDHDEANRLLATNSADPHSLLGVHPLVVDNKEGLVFRVFHPSAQKALIRFADETRLELIHLGQGLFAGFTEERKFPLQPYQVRYHLPDGRDITRIDPYQFLPTLGDLDLHLFGEGQHLKLYERMGAHLRTLNGVDGVSFAVWAPNARRVSVIGDFNDWDGRCHPMRCMGSSGIWELFIPRVSKESLYKFEIKTSIGMLRIKSDPFAFAMELRPKTGSVIWGLPNYAFGDQAWMEQRQKKDLRRSPMAIYEVHLGSWMRDVDHANGWFNYREFASRLVGHCKDHGYNFVEFLPLAEHAFDPSWGYQVTGYFAPTCRFGTPDDLCYLVDVLHQNDIGVILDWVPGHFPKDDFSLRRFDGTALYEHEDPRQGEHQDWGTLIFNFGRNEVRSFLLSNALYWLDQFHVDALRVDAVASMLYLDYSRQEDQWVPNQYGGNENLEAIEFLRQFNTQVYKNYPGAFTIAEESTSFAGVTRPVHLGGLGFGYKWNMGWMNDTLRYFQKDPIHRKYHHNDLTFGLLYAFSENFILPLSHDEVAQGKGSLYDKMPGDHWQRLANLRLLYTWMYTHPGKKLVFMGAEYGQGREWNFDRSLDWHEAGELERSGLQRLYKELSRLYQSQPALWARELEPEGFAWIDCNDSENCVLSFVRWGDGQELIVVLNFTPVVRHAYRIGTPRPGPFVELFNSDSLVYGGSGVRNQGKLDTQKIACHGHPWSIEMVLPPLGGLIFQKA